MSSKGFLDSAKLYIYQKVGEEITGIITEVTESNSEDNINTEWGDKYESEAIAHFAKRKGLDYLTSQTMIQNTETRFCSTPDAIWIRAEGIINPDEYDVSTLEVKCPRTFSSFIAKSLCKTPLDLKKDNPEHYWQVVDQMETCSAAIGYYYVYHPLFPELSKGHEIEFKKLDLWDDFKFLVNRKKEAVELFDKVKDLILNQHSLSPNSK